MVTISSRRKNLHHPAIAAAATLLILGAIVGVLLNAFLGQETVQFEEEEEVVKEERVPNIIIFLADDTGYGDLYSYGNPVQEWGPIDRMAEEGMKFTNWVAGGRACSPSRAALLTGRYPVRTGVYGNVFTEMSTGGLLENETTIAEALRDVGYKTGMVGKWHLGNNAYNSTDGSHLPIHHGFDYVGRNLPFSHNWRCDVTKPVDEQKYACFLYDGTTLIEQPINLTTLTQRLVNDSKTFIRENKDHPFFFYLSFPQSHQAVFCDPQFCGQSKLGAYGDSINEMAWAIGEVLDEIRNASLEKDTLAIFTSDNGPPHFNCFEEGSSGSFRGGKGTTFEGGYRVPAIAWWPNTIPAGTRNDDLVSTMDILPTALYLAGAEDYLESLNVTIDGMIIGDITQKNIPFQARETFFYHCSDRLMAVRHNQYKVHYFTFGEQNTRISDPLEDPVCLRQQSKPVADCYDNETVTEWDPPLVFNILSDPMERLMIDVNTTEMQNILSEFEELVQNYTITPVPSVMNATGGAAVIPCCNPPNCTCNFDENV